MAKPAFLVDGQTEQRALQNLCPGNPIRIIGCNGKTVSIKAIAKRIASLIKLLNNRNHPIIVVIDKEKRDQSIIKIKEELKEEIKLLGVNDNIFIGVCDRMIENWILADEKNFRKHIKRTRNLTEKSFEGLQGKSVVKKYYPDYHETTDGVSLLSSSNPKKMYENSSSFKDFADTISHVDCNWLKP